MTRYRISVSIDEKNSFWIVIDNGKIIKNHTKEDLSKTRIKRYNKTNICDRCIEDNNITKKSWLYPGNSFRERNESWNGLTGKYLCKSHYSKSYEKNSPNSDTNTRKSVANYMTKNVRPGSEQEKGNLAEELTHVWKGCKILNKENYNSPIDHSPDPITGLVYQTKSAWHGSGQWGTKFGNEHNSIRKGFKFDKLILYCVSKDGKIIERVYIIPEEEIKKRYGIKVYDHGHGYHWYEQYRLIGEDEMKKINDIWKKILEENNVTKRR